MMPREDCVCFVGSFIVLLMFSCFAWFLLGLGDAFQPNAFLFRPPTVPHTMSFEGTKGSNPLGPRLRSFQWATQMTTICRGLWF